VAYANSHIKITIFGTSFGGAEEWSTGFRMGSEAEGSGNFGIGAGWLAAVLPLWQTFWQDTAVDFCPHYRTVGIKAALTLEDGKTDLANVETLAYGSPIAPAGTGTNLPPQCAIVAQLAAASPVGLGAKGRMYLPATTHQLDATGHIPNADALAIANGLRTFLDGCENATNSPGYVINASKGRPGVPFTAPVNRRVTTVRVGNVVDTQRRRRNGLSETYQSATLAA
jgi:hypothetical protein